MMKNVFIILMFPIILVAQQSKQSDPSIELPEFVITGIENITLPVLPKPKAEFVSIISEDFIKPTYSPEDLPISEISNPLKQEVAISESSLVYKGRFEMGLGLQTIPTLKFTYGNTFQSGLFFCQIWGNNEREYIENAGIFNSGIDLSATFFIDNNSGFLPGAKFKVGGSYERESFNLYAPDTFYFNRNSHLGNLNLTISNLMNENVKFDVKLNDKIFYLNDRNLNENTFSIDGFFETGLKEFSIASIFKFEHQELKYDSLSQAINNFLFLNPFAVINISDVIKIQGGITYAHAGSNNFFSPYGYGALKFNDNLTFYGELNPKAEFFSLADLLLINRYFNPQKDESVFQKENLNLKVALKYEFETYFEIDAGMSFTDYRDYLYFTDEVQQGKFNLYTRGAKKLSSSVNFLFHTGPNGVFYGNLILENIKDAAGNFIPHSPSLKSKLSYGYQLSPKLKIDSKLYLASGSYGNESNLKKVNGFFDLGCRLEYEFDYNIRGYAEVANLINQKNYRWADYREKPFDIILGIDYTW
ncbi:MAG: hypothetical protein NTX22_00415 [Ignavibacteriales bacterium]|nr:hypothetical protein [Ignavibacteriales bacterium]